MNLNKLPNLILVGLMALAVGAPTIKFAHAEDPKPAAADQKADDDTGGGDEGKSGGSSPSRSSYSSPSRSSYSSPSRSSYSSPSRSTTPSYSSPSRSTTPSYSAPAAKPKPVDVGGGYTARTNKNGGIQYRDESTGKDVSRKEFESKTGATGRVNPKNGGIQFKDNSTGKDISQRNVRNSNNNGGTANVRKTYAGRPVSDYRQTKIGNDSTHWNNYRSTTNNIHIDNSINYHSYRSGMGYGYYSGGAWYGYHPMYMNGGWGYYDVYGRWAAVADAVYLAALVADASYATTPVSGVTYVQTDNGMDMSQTGQVVYDAPYDETKVTEETVTDPDGNTTTTVTKTNTSSGVW